MQHYTDFTINHFKESLKEYREKKGMSQSDLARATGMTPSTISTYEKGLRDPKCEVYCQLARALNIDPIAFFATDTTMDLLKANDNYFYSNYQQKPPSNEPTEVDRIIIDIMDCVKNLDMEDLNAILHIVKRMKHSADTERQSINRNDNYGKKNL